MKELHRIQRSSEEEHRHHTGSLVEITVVITPSHDGGNRRRGFLRVSRMRHLGTMFCAFVLVISAQFCADSPCASDNGADYCACWSDCTYLW